MRGKAYNGQVIPFGECAMFRILSDDKFEDRWIKGVFVGKLLETDEAIFINSVGVGQSRTIKRLEPSLQYDLGFLNSCKDPHGTQQVNLNTTLLNEGTL